MNELNVANSEKSNQATPVVFITGGARRIGAHVAQVLHAAGYRVVIHYRHSHAEASKLCTDFNELRADSAAVVQADFADFEQIAPCVRAAAQQWQRLDVIINNASSFFPTVVGETTIEQWQQLFSSNLMTPYFVVQAAVPFLRLTQGQVINLADIHGVRPLKGFAVYSTAKAGLIMLTKALARELGPNIRVNAIAPGITCWPEEQTFSTERRQELMQRSVLQNITAVDDIARAMLFLLQQSSMTGEVIHMDCGRLLK